MSLKINNFLPMQRTPTAEAPSQSAGTGRLDLIRGLGMPEAQPLSSGRMDLIQGLTGQAGTSAVRNDVSAMPPMIYPRGQIFDFPPYDRTPIDLPWEPPMFPSPVSPGDWNTASRLHSVLSNPEVLLEAMFDPEVGQTQLYRTPEGVVGPEGQPLFKLKTDLGMTAWVDPNTNQFYLQEPGFGGQLNVIGPMELPQGAQFDPSSFYDSGEVRELGGIARGDREPLYWQDREVAQNLHSVLSREAIPLGDRFLPVQLLGRGENGELRGPQGQPLMSVRLDDGREAYVDPNTNQYYLGGPSANPFAIEARGPLPLPPGARFTNSYFNEGEVLALSRLANRPQPRILAE